MGSSALIKISDCPKWEGCITGFIETLPSVELGLSVLTINVKLHFASILREYNHNIFHLSTQILMWGPKGHATVVYSTNSGKRKWSVRWVVSFSEHSSPVPLEHIHTQHTSPGSGGEVGGYRWRAHRGVGAWGHGVYGWAWGSIGQWIYFFTSKQLLSTPSP